jgi:hypothetical protein
MTTQIARTPAPSTRVPVSIDRRLYGVGGEADHKFNNEVPGVFQDLVVDLRQRSELLQLQNDANRTTIYAAYAFDLALLHSRVAEFESCARNAVRCSMLGDESVTNPGESSQAKWVAIRDQIPRIRRTALLELDHVHAALSEAELIAWLKEEFGRGVDRMVRLFSVWLQLLVEQSYVGLVEWTALDVARYHYFRRDRTKEVIGKTARTQESFDESRPFGERHQGKRIDESTVLTTDKLERHVHHIVEARPHTPRDYPKAVPPRVAEFLQSVPSWLMPMLHIVDGQITMEEVVRSVVGQSIGTEVEVISSWQYSPTVAFGPFSLIGWSGADLEKEGAVFYRGQQTGEAVHQVESRKNRRTALIIAVAIISVIWGIVFLVRKDNAEDAANYASYVKGLKGQLYSARIGDEIKVPSTVGVVRFSGVRWGNSGSTCYHGSTCLTFTVSNPLTARTHGDTRTAPGPYGGAGAPEGVALPTDTRYEISMPHKEFGGYGDIDLAPIMGVYATLHVRRINASTNATPDSSWVEYTVTTRKLK